jgi:excisionase family DNA binding protein
MENIMVTHAPLATSTAEPSRMLTVAQAVELLSLAPATIYRLMQSGQLVSVKVGKSRRIPARCLDAFVNAAIEEATANLPQPSYSPMRLHASAPRRRAGSTTERPADSTKARPTPAKSSRAPKEGSQNELHQHHEPRR